MKYLPLIPLLFAPSAFAQDMQNRERWTASDIKAYCYVRASEPGGQGAREFERCMRHNSSKVGKDKSPADISVINRADQYLAEPEAATPAAPAKQPSTTQMF